MADENPTLESLNNELQELKAKFENRNVFQEIANQLYDLIEIKTTIVPVIGSIVNEGEEFILKVNLGFNSYYNKPLNIEMFNCSQFTDDFRINLSYLNNCVQKKDNSGERITIVRDCDGNSVHDYKLTFGIIDLGVNLFGIMNLPQSTDNYPIEIEYHMIAAETINREQPLATVEYYSYNAFPLLIGLSKRVEIGNEVIHPG